MIKKNMAAIDLALKRPSLKLHPEDIIGTSKFLNPQCHSGAAAVVKDGQLIGILTERDLLKRVLATGTDPSHIRVKDAMTHHPTTIPVNSSLKETLDIITQSGFRYLPVMDKLNFIGMIDVRDLYTEIQKLMEETLNNERALFANIMSEPYGVDTYAISNRGFWS